MPTFFRLTPGPGKRHRGITILEVLVASVILAIGLVGVGSLITCAVISHERAVGYSVASHRATAELERIREADYVGAVMGATLFPAPTYHLLSDTQAEFAVDDLTGGHGLITLDEDPQAQVTNPSTGLPYLNLKQAQVQVWWRGRGGKSNCLAAATLIANRP